MIGFGQNVNIADANFKAYLVSNTAINTNSDTEIQVSEATAFNGTIDCSSMNIPDLTGIEDFTALTQLWCLGNLLSSLDVSQNTALTELWCFGNLLSSLDVSQNTALTYLYCSDNQLTSLDVSNNTALIYLSCKSNQLSSLDVSNNTALIYLRCQSNQLSSLDVSNNNALTLLFCADNQLTSLDVKNGNNTNTLNFYTIDNPNLSCINVDDAAWSTTNWLDIDFQHYFSNNCSPSAVQEHSTNKGLLKVTDLLGRETKQIRNKLLLYIYDDGTVEKKIIIE